MHQDVEAARSPAAEIERERFVRLCRLGLATERGRLVTERRRLQTDIDGMLDQAREAARARVWSERAHDAVAQARSLVLARMRSTVPQLRAAVIDGRLWTEDGGIAGLLLRGPGSAWRWRLDPAGGLAVIPPALLPGAPADELVRVEAAGLALTLAIADGDLARASLELRAALEWTDAPAWPWPPARPDLMPVLPEADDDAVAACLGTAPLHDDQPRQVQVPDLNGLVHARLELRRAVTGLRLLDEQILRRATRWRREYGTLLRHPTVAVCACGEETLTVVTRPIRFGDPDDPVELGSFSIVLAPADGSVRFVNLDGQLAGCDHPHVVAGSAVRGDLPGTVAADLAHGELFAAAARCLEYLLTYREGEAVVPLSLWRSVGASAAE